MDSDEDQLCSSLNTQAFIPTPTQTTPAPNPIPSQPSGQPSDQLSGQPSRRPRRMEPFRRNRRLTDEERLVLLQQANRHKFLIVQSGKSAFYDATSLGYSNVMQSELPLSRQSINRYIDAAIEHRRTTRHLATSTGTLDLAKKINVQSDHLMDFFDEMNRRAQEYRDLCATQDANIERPEAERDDMLRLGNKRRRVQGM